MPLETQTYDLGAEIERLEDRRETLAEELAGMEAGTAAARQTGDEGQRVERHLTGLRWAYERAHTKNDFPLWSDQLESIELAALNTGESDFSADVADRIDSDSAATKSYIAVGTRDAPWLAHNPDKIGTNASQVLETVTNINELHPHFRSWLEHALVTLSRGGDSSGNSFSELVRQKRLSQNSQTTSGDDTAERRP